eukprot:SAG11_NODE_21860_length_417_cov_0.584906_1_plen_28_part_10
MLVRLDVLLVSYYWYVVLPSVGSGARAA